MFRDTSFESLEASPQEKEIANAKKHLKDLKEKDSFKRTSLFWLDEIIDKAYIDLYYHLIDMQNLPNHNERKDAVKKIDFALACKIINQVRDAVVQKVIEAIPYPTSADIVFILGASGAGKSTLACALRGDTMKLSNDDLYYTSTEHPWLIEQAGATSGSLLPNTFLNDDGSLYLVDFPGFEDTNGYLVQLGLHCALKSLLNQYTPKILILNAIIDTEGRYTATAQLGALLTRLLRSEINETSKSYKEVCTLTLSKYIQDPHYIKINQLKDQIEKQKTANFNNELAVLNIQKKTLLDVIGEDNNHPLKKKIEEIDQKIESLQHSKESENEKDPIQLQLEEKIQAYQAKLTEKENEFKNQIGLNRMISLTNLDDPEQVKKYTKIFHDYPNSTGFSPILQMNSKHQKLLEFLFTEYIKTNPNPDVKPINSKEELLNLIYQNSLIHATQASSIGKFLHQQVIDSDVAKNFDVIMVEDCKREYMCSILNLNIPRIKKLLAEKAQQTTRIEQLIKTLNKLEKEVINLFRIVESNDKSTPQEVWEKINREFKSEKNLQEKSSLFTMPTWMNTITFLSFGKDLKEKPLTLKKLEAILQETDENSLKYLAGDDLETCIEEINKLCNFTSELNELEKIVNKEKSEKRQEIVRILKESGLPNDLEMKIARIVEEVPNALKTEIVSLLKELIIHRKSTTLAAKIMQIIKVNNLTTLIACIEEESAKKVNDTKNEDRLSEKVRMDTKSILFAYRQKAIDPNRIKDFSITLAEDCTRQYTNSILSLQIPHITKLIREKAQQTNITEQLIKMFSKLEEEMIKLLDCTDNVKQTAQEQWKTHNNQWKEDNEKLKVDKDSYQDTSTLPNRADILTSLSFEGDLKPLALKNLVATLEKSYQYSLRQLAVDELDATMAEVSKMFALAKEINELKKALIKEKKEIVSMKIAGIAGILEKSSLPNELKMQIAGIMEKITDDVKMRMATVLEELIALQESKTLRTRIIETRKLNELKTLINIEEKFAKQARSMVKEEDRLFEKQMMQNKSTFFAYPQITNESPAIFTAPEYTSITCK